MAWFKRIFLFIAVNILVIATITIITSLLGVNTYMTQRGLDYQKLMVFCLIWGFVGSFISLAISRWVAKFSMGIKPIDPQNCTREEKELYDTVSDLARKAGLPKTPEVGIYESPEINAFATGPTKSRSLVAVSRGLLELMNKTEVEGVLGHEIAHIANGDMVTLTLIQGVVNAFVMFFARIVAYAATQFVKEDMRPLVHLITVIALEILFGILGSIVVAWFSRAREFRADEGGAQLTGKTKMIAALRALQRRFDSTVLESQDRPQQAAALDAFKISGKPKSVSIFSTHPALEDRIEKLSQNPNVL